MGVNFALDFDGTFTEDPTTFLQIIHLLRVAGHKVYVVTMRYAPPHVESLYVQEVLGRRVDGIFYTGRKAKQPWMEEHRNDIPINIWIDDSPEWLLRDSQ